MSAHLYSAAEVQRYFERCAEENVYIHSKQAFIAFMMHKNVEYVCTNKSQTDIITIGLSTQRELKLMYSYNDYFITRCQHYQSSVERR